MSKVSGLRAVWFKDPPLYDLGDYVENISDAAWRGHVVGFYSTDLTPIGYAVESDAHPGSVQIYPEKALRLVEPGHE